MAEPLRTDARVRADGGAFAAADPPTAADTLSELAADRSPRRSATLRSVPCPRCAGALAVRDGDHMLRCSHCGTPFLAPARGGFERRFYPTRVEKLSAVGRASRWLREHPDTPSDIAESAFTDATLLYVPIWEIRAHVVGWEFGKKLRNKAEVVRVGDQDVVQSRLVEEGVEAAFLGERRMYQEAADISVLGISRPLMTGRELTLPYLVGELERDAVVLEADRDVELVRARAHESFLRPATGTVTRQTKLFLIRKSEALIYYPIWSLHYRYRDRVYEMAVDGRNGLVHSARAPADNRGRLAALLASYVALALLLALAVSAWESWEGFREPALYAALLVLTAASGVYWRFRLIREVEYHEPFSA